MFAANENEVRTFQRTLPRYMIEPNPTQPSQLSFPFSQTSIPSPPPPPPKKKPSYLLTNLTPTSPGGANVIGLPALQHRYHLSTSSLVFTPSPSLTRCLLSTVAKKAANSAVAKRLPRQARGPSEKVRKVPRVWRGVKGEGEGGVVVLVVVLFGWWRFGWGESQREGERVCGEGQ